MDSETFLYFAFGSNLLSERIHINNPSAIKVNTGKLEGYRLKFDYYSERWKGAVATIVEDTKKYVHGVLWRINLEDLKNLDKQEGVDKGIYRPIEVVVKTSSGEKIAARSYQLINTTHDDCKPSLIYLNVIIKGAVENQLPQDYIRSLEEVDHNGYDGRVDINLELS